MFLVFARERDSSNFCTPSNEEKTSANGFSCRPRTSSFDGTLYAFFLRLFSTNLFAVEFASCALENSTLSPRCYVVSALPLIALTNKRLTSMPFLKLTDWFRLFVVCICCCLSRPARSYSASSASVTAKTLFLLSTSKQFFVKWSEAKRLTGFASRTQFPDDFISQGHGFFFVALLLSLQLA